MSVSCRVILRNCNLIRSITKPVTWNVKSYSKLISSGISYENAFYGRPTDEIKRVDFIAIRQYATEPSDNVQKPEREQKPKKPGLVQRFKEMYRDYWYVLLPVHLCTSAVWFGSFYYAVRSGVDVISILESLNISEKLLEPVKNSSAGYFALAFALYKLATPLRYAVTVGGTTFAIKKLTAIGWIKPVPSRERIKEMLQEKRGQLQEKRDNLQDRFNESKQHYQDQMKAKHTQIMDEMKRYKTEVKKLKNKVKK